MAEFNYEIPDNNSFFKAILLMVNTDMECITWRIFDILKDGHCKISKSSSFSQNRWDAFASTVYFYVPTEKIAQYNVTLHKIKSTLIRISQTVMPADAGLDIVNVELSPILDTVAGDDFNEIFSSSDTEYLSILSEDIKEKGKEMAEAYTMLYCVENAIRMFIDRTLETALGNDYISKILIPKDVKSGLDKRKKNEQKNLWLPLRGGKDIFYLDFIDLSIVITNNWEHFKTLFPNQGWISTKMNELYQVRNLIAHNSYIEKNEREIIKLYYKQIAKQLSSK